MCSCNFNFCIHVRITGLNIELLFITNIIYYLVFILNLLK